ncbi:derlin-1-like [Branchiostoma lanceolatum]|uniref:Derlin n=1 Tax=Branchiostoma lanceolatum TaxID=7740 RepID=A0A8K0A5H6_BRALA|nr:DERL1 [Branchiostoma lanceolatum]
MVEGSDIGDWFRSIPLITRYWFALSVALPLLGRIGLVDAMSMILHWDLTVYHFQIWRPVTALFFYPLMPQTGFHYLINLYFLYNYSTRLETGLFDGRPADYLFMLIFQWLCLVIIGFMAELFLLMDPMILAVLYVWCQLNRDQIVSFWFGTQFKAMYLPWVLVGFNMILRGGGWTDLLGIFVGHLYFFLMFKYPQDFGGRSFLSTPEILYRYLPNRRGGVSGFGVPPASRRRADDNQRQGWGQGNVLGGN